MKNGSVVQDGHELCESAVSVKFYVCVTIRGGGRIAGGQYASDDALVAARALSALCMAFRGVTVVLILATRILPHGVPRA